MEPPAHPESDDTGGQKPSPTVSWGTVLAVAVIAALLVAMVILHVTGVVGPAAR